MRPCGARRAQCQRRVRLSCACLFLRWRWCNGRRLPPATCPGLSIERALEASGCAWPDAPALAAGPTLPLPHVTLRCSTPQRNRHDARYRLLLWDNRLYVTSGGLERPPMAQVGGAAGAHTPAWLPVLPMAATPCCMQGVQPAACHAYTPLPAAPPPCGPTLQVPLYYHMLTDIQDAAKRFGAPNLELGLGFGDMPIPEPARRVEPGGDEAAGLPERMCPLLAYAKIREHLALLVPSGEFVWKQVGLGWAGGRAKEGAGREHCAKSMHAGRPACLPAAARSACSMPMRRSCRPALLPAVRRVCAAHGGRQRTQLGG